METWKIILITVSALAGAAMLGTGIYYSVTHKTATTNPLEAYNPEVVAAYKAWTIKYNKKESDPDVAAYRMGIFADNFQMIKDHNEKGKEYTLGENQFMDLTHNEFKSTYLGLVPKKEASPFGTHKHSGKSASSIDWTKKGDVQKVKDQGQCGSCWAFSTVASLESDDAIFGSELGDFSEQQLVDCSTSYGNNGCNGGLMDYAFKYVIDNGITTESNYPYKAVDQKCNTSATKKIAFQIKSYKDVSEGDCDSLADAIQGQPISIGVDAESWQFYSGGVFSDCGTQLDHGVLLAGYEADQYWSVKNSWGTSWGEKGYIRLAKGNTCGICNTASYPVLN